MKFPFAVFSVQGNSMTPTIRSGERLLVSRWSRIQSNNVVIFEKGGLSMVKRAVQKETHGWHVRGDNPSESTDSLDFGAVSFSDIIGKVIWKF